MVRTVWTHADGAQLVPLFPGRGPARPRHSAGARGRGEEAMVGTSRGGHDPKGPAGCDGLS